MYRKKVCQFDLEGNFIKDWVSVRQAEKELKIGHISKVCNNIGSFKTSGGYIWKFDNF